MRSSCNGRLRRTKRASFSNMGLAGIGAPERRYQNGFPALHFLEQSTGGCDEHDRLTAVCSEPAGSEPASTTRRSLVGGLPKGSFYSARGRRRTPLRRSSSMISPMGCTRSKPELLSRVSPTTRRRMQVPSELPFATLARAGRPWLFMAIVGFIVARIAIWVVQDFSTSDIQN